MSRTVCSDAESYTMLEEARDNNNIKGVRTLQLLTHFIDSEPERYHRDNNMPSTRRNGIAE